MKKVLVLDWLDKYGGAERGVSSITRLFDFKKCYTLINIMDKEDVYKTFSDKKVEIVQSNIKFFGRYFRMLFPLFPYFIKKMKIDTNAEIIISSSFSVAKGVEKTNKKQIHFCYYQARNQRYIWDNSNIYFSPVTKFILFPVLRKLKQQDISQSKNPDYIISNSKYIQQWIQKHYNRKSFVIYPPVDTNKFYLNTKKENYFVTAARLEPYKRIDLLVKAFNHSKEKLIIIGSGSQKRKLIKIANNNIKFIDYSSSDVVHSFVSKAKAFVHAGLEDFGITLVESQACGTPVIAYGSGGAAETVIDRRTGILFKEQTTEAILEAIKRFNETKFDYSKLRENAERYSVENFEKKLHTYIENKTKEWQEKNKDAFQDT